jgi:ParB/RepB/Spo0J family partition protein
MTKKTSPAYRASKEETIPINKLHPFSNHPFHIRHDLEFSELVDSISESGIITPIIVRPKVGVGYEVISGHRRWEACKELGIESIPARVEYIDDDEATILMVNSNIQREHVLPSEKAFAYKMRMEAMKHQGKATSSQLGTKLRTLDAMGKEVDESRNQIHRYIRLTYLIPSILQMVDDGRIAFNPAVEISYMTEEHQTWLKEEMDMCDATPSTGKTTTAYNLGIALTQQGYRVLMVDFDPQGNLSCYCGIPPEQDLEQTITELLMKVAYEKPLSHRECVYQSKRTDDSAPQVDFIPSNLRLASFELAMGTMMCREVLLKTCLEQYSSQYDYCIIDCSPSVGLLLTNALSAANEVIIPMQAQPFSVVGMSQLTNSISSVQRKINPGLHIRGVLLTMTQHTKVSEHYAHDVRAKYGRTLRVFTTEIPYNVKVQESQAFAAPTILYEPKSSSARAYVDFTQEVLGHGREEQVYERDEDARDR